MARVTQPYSNSFSGSVGSGLGSLFGGSGKQYYILEHKISSRYHRVGESQEIIVDRVEIGRDARCQVRFDDSFTTVSRRHAAIIREGDKWKLVQLSATNPTFLNGVTVKNEWYLQNGDEIQLSVGGPKLGFIVPGGNRSTVGTIGLSRRLSLFRQQALRPYKQAMTVMAIALCLLVAGFVGWGVYSNQKQGKLLAENTRLGGELEALNEKAIELTVEADKNQEALKTINTERERLANQIQQNNAQNRANQREMENLQRRVDNVNTMVLASSTAGEASPAGSGGVPSTGSGGATPAGSGGEGSATPASSGGSAPAGSNIAETAANENVSGRGVVSVSDINNYSPFVYAITLEKTVITYANGTTKVIEEQLPQVVGTGFMLNDGRFVTARHVLEPWYYYEVIKTSNLLDYNIIANNGGTVVSYFNAISNSGNFSFNSGQARTNRTTDKIESIRQGRSTAVVRKAVIDDTDWAFIASSRTTGFQSNRTLSSNLQIGAELEILGFPYGRGVQGIDITPIYSTCNVARQGLDVNGTIMVSNDNTERGNAGGPVLIKNEGEYQIVGVMSGSTFAKGRIVPISALQ